MTKLEELKTDLAIHKESLIRVRNPEYQAYMLKFKKIAIGIIEHSYVRIIKSIEDEIKALESKRKKK